jgi:3-hydroxybutyrate dehydrogenase
VHGLVASVEKAAYIAAKHGLIGLTKVVALETARTKITCNAICPGFVLTPLVEKQIRDRATRDSIDFDAAKVALISEKMPSGDPVTPEAIGGVAVFLCSSAADQMRGAALTVDGGWTAQ